MSPGRGFAIRIWPRTEPSETPSRPIVLRERLLDSQREVRIVHTPGVTIPGGSRYELVPDTVELVSVLVGVVEVGFPMPTSRGAPSRFRTGTFPQDVPGGRWIVFTVVRTVGESPS